MKALGLDERTQRLRRMVSAARHEADYAVACREAWRQMAHDSDLHLRMGQSFASNTFLTIRVALWREVLAALMRIWDKRPDSIDLNLIMMELQKEDVLTKLFDENRREPINDIQIRQGMLETLSVTVGRAVKVFEIYKSGDGVAAFKHLTRIRHEQLAHRQNEELTKMPADWSDERIDKFCADTMTIVSLLLSAVESVAYDLDETARVYSHHARLFWASARGERTDGHPNYRALPNLKR